MLFKASHSMRHTHSRALSSETMNVERRQLSKRLEHEIRIHGDLPKPFRQTFHRRHEIIVLSAHQIKYRVFSQISSVKIQHTKSFFRPTPTDIHNRQNLRNDRPTVRLTSQWKWPLSRSQACLGREKAWLAHRISSICRREHDLRPGKKMQLSLTVYPGFPPTFSEKYGYSYGMG